LARTPCGKEGCLGINKLVAESDWVECAACEGTGAMTKCERCQGAGWLIVRDFVN
jgi:DnaJ-class molecular chaperone